jgi:hypothetical protein
MTIADKLSDIVARDFEPHPFSYGIDQENVEALLAN